MLLSYYCRSRPRVLCSAPPSPVRASRISRSRSPSPCPRVPMSPSPCPSLTFRHRRFNLKREGNWTSTIRKVIQKDMNGFLSFGFTALVALTRIGLLVWWLCKIIIYKWVPEERDSLNLAERSSKRNLYDSCSCRRLRCDKFGAYHFSCLSKRTSQFGTSSARNSSKK